MILTVPASFDAAARADPKCAICFWGLAWSLGPNLNADMHKADAARVAGVQRQHRHRHARAKRPGWLAVHQRCQSQRMQQGLDRVGPE